MHSLSIHIHSYSNLTPFTFATINKLHSAPAFILGASHNAIYNHWPKPLSGHTVHHLYYIDILVDLNPKQKRLTGHQTKKNKKKRVCVACRRWWTCRVERSLCVAKCCVCPCVSGYFSHASHAKGLVLFFFFFLYASFLINSRDSLGTIVMQEVLASDKGSRGRVTRRLNRQDRF